MRSEVRQRTELIVFRLLPDEALALRAVAVDLGVSVSSLVRNAALEAIGYEPVEGGEPK